ncbi:hypothetical protein U719_14175 [Exiguobacterium sp. MH3]|nr:hypothetical protein U719_14175 [Exiguobacterium sp. MH3]
MTLILKETRRNMTSCAWCLNAATVSVAPLAHREMDQTIAKSKKDRNKTA